MILHLYFARRYLMYFLSVAAVFAIFIGLIDLVEQLRRYGDDTSFGNVLILTFLNSPSSFYETLPLVMILSAVWLFVALARSSELVVTRSVGRSALQFLIAPVSVGLIMGGLTVGVLNPIVAGTMKKYSDQLDLYVHGGGSDFSIGSEGLWLRQGDAASQTVIRASRSNADGTVFYGVTLVTLDATGRPSRRIEADTAQLDKGEWAMTSAKVWPIEFDKNPETQSFFAATYRIPSSLTTDQIRDRFGKPSSVSIWNLSNYITNLQNAGFSARRYTVWQQMEFARPLFLVSMLLIGASFTMGHSRFGGTGLSILSAVLMGFSMYYVRNFAQILGENGQIPIYLAAWAPPIAATLFALAIILHKEDG